MIGNLINFNIFKSPPPEPELGDVPQEIKTTRSRQAVIESIEARINEQRTFAERLADSIVRTFGNIRFAMLNLCGFILWIFTNTGFVPSVEPFDPYPFVLLITIVSLEAIFLSTFVLISQNREAKISDLREELDLQINLIAEREITKIIHLLSYLMKHLNIPYEKDPELKRMMRPLDTDEIRKEIERQLKLPPTK